MKKCSNCGHETDQEVMKCPACGSYYSKIIQLIDEEAENEERNTFQGCWRRIAQSNAKGQALKQELIAASSTLNRTSRFTLLIVFVFVFALIVSVL